jgi:hypothetical protein
MKLYSVTGEGNGTVKQESSLSTQASPQRNWGSTLGQFQEEFDVVKNVVTGAVMSTVMGTLKEMIRQNIPSMASQFDKAANRIAKKWGAEPEESAATYDPSNRSGHVQPATGPFSVHTPAKASEPYGKGE